jgi:hypothetical protein
MVVVVQSTYDRNGNHFAPFIRRGRNQCVRFRNLLRNPLMGSCVRLSVIVTGRWQAHRSKQSKKEKRAKQKTNQQPCGIISSVVVTAPPGAVEHMHTAPFTCVAFSREIVLREHFLLCDYAHNER